MNSENMKVLVNIIGAVETGGQVYGKRRYADYTAPYTNSSLEHTITLGWAAFYGDEARTLMNNIYKADKNNFIKLDSANIQSQLTVDWVATRWNPTASQKKAIIAIIDSEVGHQEQDKLFALRMEKFIQDCESSYTKNVPAQMMYCEIRHLGGKSAVDRIFKKCNKNYSLDNIMAALKLDQQDSSSNNQVGDTKYWSRHEKCYTFIKQYAKTEEEKDMAVKIGSARSDEYGGSGWDGRAKAGDQKSGNEVSTQDWYLHSKGWVVIRAKDASIREKIAYAMQRACDNNNVGYDQSERDTAWNWCAKHNNWDPGAINTPVETDCSSLVKLCCRYAGITNISGYFNTTVETQKLKDTGYFDVLTDTKYTNSSDYLLRGDILNTKTQGHTVVVLSNGAKAQVVKGTYVYNGVCYDDEFDPKFYADKYADLKKAFGYDAAKLLQHWVTYGKKEGRVAIASKEVPVVVASGTGVAKTDMNVRTGSSTKDEIIGLVKKGETVKIVETLSNGWLKIVWSKAKAGYAYVSNRNNAYFTVNTEFPYTVQVTASALYIRKGPGTNYATNGVVHNGEKYVITAIENEKWAKLQNGKGYISMKYAKKV